MKRRAGTVFTRLAAGVAAVLVAAMVPSSAQAAPPRVPAAGYGFGDGAQLTWLNGADVARELDAVGKTSASWLRVLIPWTLIEPAQGQYDWRQTDLVVNAAAARGLKVLGVIAYSPDWARDAGTTYSAPPRDPADYAGFAKVVAQRYGGRISNWQLWNEPNLPQFFGFVPNGAPIYASLVRAAYPAIKAVQPSSTVVLAGFSRLPGNDAPPAYLQQLYGAGVRGSFDAAAAHPYVFPTGLAANPENGWSDVSALHDVMAGNGDGGKRIWMTEFGAPTSEGGDGVSQQEQAKQITDVLAAVANLPYSGPAFIYSIRDTDTANRGDRESNFGALLTSDYQPKFAASVLAR